jgi:hypothetical protein
MLGASPKCRLATRFAGFFYADSAGQVHFVIDRTVNIWDGVFSGADGVVRSKGP